MFRIDGEPDLSDIVLFDYYDTDYNISKMADFDNEKIKEIYKMQYYEFRKQICFRQFSNFVEHTYFERKKDKD